MTERVLEVAPGDGDLVVRVRLAAAGTDRAPARALAWTEEDGALGCEVAVEPEGDWPFPLPRLGTGSRCPRLGPARLVRARAGRGLRRLARRRPRRPLRAGVDELQTPYVMPQENGNRAAVRWARLTDDRGAGLPSRAARTWS